MLDQEKLKAGLVDVEAKALRLKTDPRYFIESFFSVKDRKTNKTVPFLLNPVQERYVQSKSNFDMILKSRKMGLSSYIIAEDLWSCIMHDNQHAVFICQNQEEVSKQFELRVKPLLDSCVVPIRYKSLKEYIVFPDTSSRYYIGAAGQKTFGRGSDITRYHISEYAFFENPTIMTGIEEACLDGAVGRIETTANGINFFHGSWKRAEQGLGRYKPIFYPWFLDKDYRIVGAKPYVLDEIETNLMQAFDLDFEQLAWRREKIKNMSRPELFAQEFPSTPDEAFLSSGRMVFDWVALLKHEQTLIKPQWRGYLKDMGDVIEFVPMQSGGLEIWEQPQDNHVYVIGGDIAEGIEGGAYSAAFVLDVGARKQVAAFHGHIPPDRFGDVLFDLGMYYNVATVVPESWPGPGGVTMSRLVQRNYRNLWKRQRGTYSNRTDDQLYGWETNKRTKQDMILSLSAAIRDHDLVIYDQGLHSELRSFVYAEDGDMEPQLGCFSDRVIAAAIAWRVSRDLGEVNYAAPRLKDRINRVINATGVSIPRYKGRTGYGRREE